MDHAYGRRYDTIMCIYMLYVCVLLCVYIHTIQWVGPFVGVWVVLTDHQSPPKSTHTLQPPRHRPQWWTDRPTTNIYTHPLQPPQHRPQYLRAHGHQARPPPHDARRGAQDHQGGMSVRPHSHVSRIMGRKPIKMRWTADHAPSKPHPHMHPIHTHIHTQPPNPHRA